LYCLFFEFKSLKIDKQVSLLKALCTPYKVLFVCSTAKKRSFALWNNDFFNLRI